MHAFLQTRAFLTNYKTIWYKNFLPLTVGHVMIRDYRKVRLGNSHLRNQASFINSNCRICRQCVTHKPETAHHFLLECPSYVSQRKSLLDKISKIYAGHIDEKLLLGFSPGFQSRSSIKKTHKLRKEIMQHVLKYFEDTERFSDI